MGHGLGLQILCFFIKVIVTNYPIFCYAYYLCSYEFKCYQLLAIDSFAFHDISILFVPFARIWLKTNYQGCIGWKTGNISNGLRFNY